MKSRLQQEFANRVQKKAEEYLAAHGIGQKKHRAGRTPASKKHAVPQSAKKIFSAIAPGIHLQAYLQGRKVLDWQVGKRYQIYDLASLTKIIFAASCFMELVAQKKIDLNKSVRYYLPWWPYSKMRIKELLSHTSGLTWWAPFYKTWKKKNNSARKQNFLSRDEVQRILLTIPVNEKNAKSRAAIYSDLDLILAGFVLEEVTGLDLLHVWLRSYVHRKIRGLHFVPGHKPPYARSSYAPTEKCPWRKKVLRGEVHDDNTWSFGGVSTHAGLFGTIEDVSRFGLLLRRAYRKGQTGWASKAVVKKFAKRAIPRRRGDWGLGFMLPTRGGASCGKYFSPESFGHTGFTGTSLWYDPKRDLLVTIVSNRVHPTRKNNHFVKLRPLLHDGVFEVLQTWGLLK